MRDVVPIPATEQPELEATVPHGRRRVLLNVHGRRVALFGFASDRTGRIRSLAILGPGLIAALAGDDAGGVATYSSVGAKFGYELLWMLLMMTLALAVVQEMCARLGAATGRGLLDLIRERYGIGWALVAVAVVLLANGGVIVTELAGIGAAVELFGLSKYLVVPLAAASVWYLTIAGSYARADRLFLAMALVFCAYPITAIIAGPDWGAVARGAFVPSVRLDPDYIMLFAATVGTTITPYMQLFQQSAVVEKGVARRHYGPERIDAYAGAIFSNLVAASIIIATGATLHVAGTTEIDSAGAAAQALAPVAGDLAQAIFAVGLLGASLLAAGVLPLATAYSVSETFGFRKGVDLDFRRAPVFVGLFSALLAIGAAVALIPNVPLIQLLIAVQTLNGALLPVLLVFLLLLINDRQLVGDLKNGRIYNLLAWGTLVFVTLAVLALFGTQLLGLFAVNLAGG